jgi:hypothetical protein
VRKSSERCVIVQRRLALCALRTKKPKFWMAIMAP